MIWGLRGTFALILAIIGYRIADVWWRQSLPGETAKPWWGVLAGLVFATICIVVEVNFTRRFVAVISTVLFGVIFGFIASYLFFHSLLLIDAFNKSNDDFKDWIQFSSMAIFIYLAVVGIIQSKDDFKFVIPFVELKKEEKGPKPLLLDTSVVIDGRIADVIDMHLISSKVILPRFVLNELQQVADSQDKLKRNRGRRGLDILNRMQRTKGTAIEIYEGNPPTAEGVDGKLVALAKFLDARLVTNDFNLNKVAQLQGVEVVNLNDLAVAMRPVILPGETLEVKIQKPGDSHGQGVGYLEDGTMVVVEGGYHRISEVVPISVTSVIQTSAGRMIFGQLKGQSQVPQSGVPATPPVTPPVTPPANRGRGPRPTSDLLQSPVASAEPGRPKTDSYPDNRSRRKSDSPDNRGGRGRPSDPATPPSGSLPGSGKGSDTPMASEPKGSDIPAPAPKASEAGGGAKVS